MKIKKVSKKWKGNQQYFYKITTLNQGMELTEKDLDLLYFLLNTRYATKNQLYRYYSLLDSRHYQAFKNRLLKMEKLNLIKSYYLKDNPHYRKNKYHCITRTGVSCLYHTGIIIKDSERRRHNKRVINAMSSQQQCDHTLSTTEITIRFLEAAKMNNKRLIFKSTFDYELFRGDHVTVKSDATLYAEDKENDYIHIEMDMGTESLSRIHDKFKNYKESILTDHVLNPVRHRVVFVVVDDSIQLNKEYPSNRVQRVRNILEIAHDYEIEDYLEFSVLSMTGVIPKVIHNIIDASLIDDFNYPFAFQSYLEREDIEFPYAISRNQPYDFETFGYTTQISLKHRERDETRAAILVPLLGGDVRSYHTLKRLIKRWEGGEVHADHIIVLMGKEAEVLAQPLPMVNSKWIDAEGKPHIPVYVAHTDMTDDMNKNSFLPVYHTNGKQNHYETLDYEWELYRLHSLCLIS